MHISNLVTYVKLFLWYMVACYLARASWFVVVIVVVFTVIIIIWCALALKGNDGK